MCKNESTSGEQANHSGICYVKQWSGLDLIFFTMLIVDYLVQNQIARSLYQNWCPDHLKEKL